MPIPTVKLSNGVLMPAIGIGSSGEFGGYGHEATVYAIQDCGMRLVDTAAIYGTEKNVGKAINESGIPRQDFFITTKLWFTDMGYESGKKALQASLKALNLEYVDLYLIHMPNCPDGTTNPTKTRQDTWRVLHEAYEQGICKSIGVSNYDVRHLEELQTMQVVPHVNQIEYHPFQDPNRDVIKYCKANNIVLQAYSPFCAGKAVSHPEIIKVAQKNKRTQGQVILRWIIQHGIVPVPKTAKVERAKENSTIFDFQLSKEDMDAMDNIHKDSFHTLNPFKDVP
ncbi:glyoxal reductase-like [Amphiura filiformis]|uniref:glyoxal reductase-like n=1 Tax=Amphiura filiformis TaxID=82378 RepID=UPI003B221437